MLLSSSRSANIVARSLSFQTLKRLSTLQASSSLCLTCMQSQLLTAHSRRAKILLDSSRAVTRTHKAHTHGRSFSTSFPQRTIFDFARPSEERRLREPVLGAGMVIFLDLRRKARLQSRLPPSASLVLALEKFLTEMSQHTGRTASPVEDVRVGYLFDASRVVIEDYTQLQEQSMREGSDKGGRLSPAAPELTILHVRMALRVLARKPKGPTNLHRELAVELIQYADRLTSESGRFGRSLDGEMVVNAVTILSFSGDHTNAQDLIYTYSSSPDANQQFLQASWLVVTKSLFQSSNSESAQWALEQLLCCRIPLAGRLYGYLIKKASTPEIARMAYDRARTIDTFSEQDRKFVTASIITASAQLFHSFPQNALLPLQSLVEGLCEKAKSKTLSPPHPEIVTAVLCWTTSTSADETVKKLLAYFCKAQDLYGLRLVSTRTINEMMLAALRAQKWDLVVRLPELARQYQIAPDTRTFTILAENQLNRTPGSLDSLASANTMLQEAIRIEDETGDAAASEAVGKLLDRIIVSKLDHIAERRTSKLSDSMVAERAAVSDVLDLVEDLGVRKCHFSASLTRRLVVFHLERDEIYDVIDLLRTHAFLYSSTDRQKILEGLVHVVTSPKTPTATAWDTYTVIEETFGSESGTGELGFGVGIELMNGFFAKGRADMACLVFERVMKLVSMDMKSYTTFFGRACIDFYVVLFTGIAQTADPASLDFAYGHLKLDQTVNPNTRLLNAVMLAHAACAVPPSDSPAPGSQPVVEVENQEEAIPGGDADSIGLGEATYAPSDDVGVGCGPSRAIHALDIFSRIVSQRAGPSQSSISIVLWACEQLAIAAGEDMPAARAAAINQAIVVWKRVVQLLSEWTGDDARTDFLAGDQKGGVSGGNGNVLPRWNEQVLAGFSAALAAAGEIEVVQDLLSRQDAQVAANEGRRLSPSESAFGSWHHRPNLSALTKSRGESGDFNPGASSSSESGSSGSMLSEVDIETLAGVPVTADVLAAFYNAVQDRAEQRRILSWMGTRFPTQLEELTTRGGGRRGDGKGKDKDWSYFEVERVLVP